MKVTYSPMPPSYFHVSSEPSPRSSIRRRASTGVRNAISRMRRASVSRSKRMSSKISPSGKKVIEVLLCPSHASPLLSEFCGSPLA